MKKRLHQLGILAAVLIGLTGLAAGLSPQTDKYFEMIKNLEIFTDLYMELNTHYVDEIDPGRLMRTGIDAMVGSLDPYTNYISESDIEGYRFQVEGKYHGIGAKLEKIGDYMVVTELYEDQPADRAGLKPGDRILAVDGQDAKGRTPEQLEDILRGFPGTTAAPDGPPLRSAAACLSSVSSTRTVAGSLAMPSSLSGAHRHHHGPERDRPERGDPDVGPGAHGALAPAQLLDEAPRHRPVAGARVVDPVGRELRGARQWLPVEPGCAPSCRCGTLCPSDRLASFHKLSEEIDERLRPGFGKPGGPSLRG